MHIIWYGLSSFKLISKDVVLFTDPFGKAAGPTPPRGAGNIIVSSNPDSEYYNNFSSITGEPFIVDGPGEYDIKGVFIRGIPASPAQKAESEKKAPIIKQAIYLINMEGINLGFLGAYGRKELSDAQIEELNDMDVLLVPVGGNGVCDAEAAVGIANALEPKIVIPMHYKTPGMTLKLDSLERFGKEMGSKGEELDKLIIKKSDLEEEKTRVVILSPQRGQ